MKKFIAIIFLSVFLYNIGGYLIAFMIMRGDVREEMQERRTRNNENDLPIIRIADHNSSDALHWRSDDEFEYQGHLYDVMKTVRQHDTTLYECVNDTKEETLVTNVNTHVKNHIEGSETRDNNSKSPVKDVTKDYFHLNIQLSSFQEGEEIQYLNDNTFYAVTHQEIPTPPPKV